MRDPNLTCPIFSKVFYASQAYTVTYVPVLSVLQMSS